MTSSMHRCHEDVRRWWCLDVTRMYLCANIFMCGAMNYVLHDNDDNLDNPKFTTVIENNPKVCTLYCSCVCTMLLLCTVHNKCMQQIHNECMWTSIFVWTRNCVNACVNVWMVWTCGLPGTHHHRPLSCTRRQLKLKGQRRIHLFNLKPFRFRTLIRDTPCIDAFYSRASR